MRSCRLVLLALLVVLALLAESGFSATAGGTYRSSSTACVTRAWPLKPEDVLSRDSIVAKTAVIGPPSSRRPCHRPFTQMCIIDILMAERRELREPELLQRAPVNENRVQSVQRTGKPYQQLLLIRELIAGGANVNAQPELYEGVSPLMVAASMGNLPLLVILLRTGASPESKLATGVASQASALMLAAGNGHDVVVRHLIEHGADVHCMGTLRIGTVIVRATPMFWAAMMPSARAMEHLSEAGAKIDQQLPSGATILSWFVGRGSVASVQALIRAGANVNLVDNRGRTPLMYARLRSDGQGEAVVNLLLASGASDSCLVAGEPSSDFHTSGASNEPVAGVATLSMVALVLATLIARAARSSDKKLLILSTTAANIVPTFIWRVAASSTAQVASPVVTKFDPGDMREWSCEQVVVWVATVVRPNFGSYVARVVGDTVLDGKGLYSLKRLRAERLLRRGTSCHSCPMSADEIVEVAESLLARRDALLAGSRAAKVMDKKAPDQFYCSISLEVMVDPVRLCTGQVYEREEITRWLRCNLTPRCPNTNTVLKSKELVPDAQLKAEINAWRAAVSAVQ